MCLAVLQYKDKINLLQHHSNIAFLLPLKTLIHKKASPSAKLTERQ